ncbi:MAG: hypothetical protein GC190_16060 [Alphaproteobacteria bacterium]|nr:hypothetical protein [Alphaproteobacteria bacterium]
MESEEQYAEWPLIEYTDVPNFCRQICEAVVELERAYEAGQLSSLLASGTFEEALGSSLYRTYSKLGDNTPGPLQMLRVDAVSALLAQLRNDLVPSRSAHAKVRMPSAGDASRAESRSYYPLSASPYEFFDARFDDESYISIHIDQMLDARFWGIGFSFEAPDLCNEFARRVVRIAVGRLANDLLGLQKIIDRFNPKTQKQELKIVPYPVDRRFEHLMLDVLNEEGRHARVAPIVEDFLEKTDLRVRYAGLQRKLGSRVQVTSVAEPELHKAKLGAIKLAEEFVFLSPLSLAEYVVSLQGRTRVNQNSDALPFELASLWDCLDEKPMDVLQLASELKRVMLQAMSGPPNSPLGPMVRVPHPLRHLIRHFVETHAFTSTARLRERQSNYRRQ